MINHVGIAGPISLVELAPLVSGASKKLCSQVGSGGTQVNYLIKALVKRGKRVDVFTLGNILKEERILEGPNLRVYIGRSDKKLKSSMLKLFSEERKLLCRQINRRSPEVINAHWTAEYALGAIASAVPAVITVRDVMKNVVRFDPSLYHWFRWGMQEWCLYRGQHFTANSPYTADYLVQRGINPVTLTPNMLPKSMLKLSTRSQKAHREENLELITVNNGFSRGKNVSTLLKAFPLIRQEFPMARLILVGKGYERDGEAFHWAKERKLTEGVHFKGPVSHDEIQSLMAQSALLVHPSLEESFGNTLIEGMATGTPVVGGAQSGAVPWVLGHGEAGLLVDMRSPEGISRGINELLADATLRRRIATAGRKRVEEKFMISQVIDKYLNAYAMVTN